MKTRALNYAAQWRSAQCPSDARVEPHAYYFLICAPGGAETPPPKLREARPIFSDEMKRSYNKNARNGELSFPKIGRKRRRRA